jgi:hypothetical protein
MHHLCYFGCHSSSIADVLFFFSYLFVLLATFFFSANCTSLLPAKRFISCFLSRNISYSSSSLLYAFSICSLNINCLISISTSSMFILKNLFTNGVYIGSSLSNLSHMNINQRMNYFCIDSSLFLFFNNFISFFYCFN